MRSATPVQSMAALAACLLLASLALGFSAVFVYRAFHAEDTHNSARPQDSMRSEASSTESILKSPKSEELVRPFKVWPHASRDDDHPSAWQPTPQELRSQDSGHYRGLHAQMWDPHPRYEFTGLGRTFRLNLRPSKPVTPHGITVLHVWENFTREVEPSLNPRGCMYTGEVVGDPRSKVSLSLCHGMRGHIWTSEGSYTIEPAEKWTGPKDNMLHLLSKVPTIRHSTCHHRKNDYFPSDFTEPPREPPKQSSRRTKRSNREYTIELMVVADKKTRDFHGDDIHHYIVSLISAVDTIFKDPSIGNPMSVALVEIRILEEYTSWSSLHAEQMLEQFCIYQNNLNTPDDSDIYHHDTAIYLTRESVCRKDDRKGKCDTVGFAEVGGMCRENHANSCAIVRDAGLSSVYTIAHELGHILSLPHDIVSNRSKCSSYITDSDDQYLMSTILTGETMPWAWSNCSRHYLTAFLEEGHGFCLEDQPVLSMGDDAKEKRRQLLGEKFGVDKQCELAYGKGYRLCERLTECNELWCKKGTLESCYSVHAPWADGTECGAKGEGKWCQKRNCVYKEALTPVNGGWGKWQRYGECSRTCGGGVRTSVRECNNPFPANGGKYCLGDRVRYRSCNTNECPPGSQDFRDLQCAEFNNDNFNDRDVSENVKWEPKYDGISIDERCRLYCRDPASNKHFMLQNKVIDGTPCGPNTFDICVNGQCTPAGCDHVLYSEKQLDYCGQCGGDNSTCKLITGSYNKIQYNYRSIDTIPEGASNLEVRQHGYLNSNKDNNFLALFDNETGQYFLNGNFQVSGKKILLYGGTTLEYSGSDAVVEKITSSRPLTKDLNIQVCSYGTVYPPDISYEYTIPIKSLDKFTWGLTDEWTPCDRACNGESWQVYKCRRKWQEFSSELCADKSKDKPPTRACNTHCQLEWEAVEKSECSSDCGRGYRTIKFECVMIENGHRNFTHESACQDVSKPLDREICEGQCIEPKWVFSAWGECSKSCGSGIRTRKAYCMDSKKQKRDDRECQFNEKKTEELCNTQHCPEWKVGNWTSCSVTCGGGKRHREFWCQYEGKQDRNERCPLPQPVITENCNNESCPYWITGEWSECSVTCGTGEETRSVYCSVPNACTNSSKPSTTRLCYHPECSLGHANAIPGDPASKFSWRQKWTECSVSCGKGETSSSFECYDNIYDKVTDLRNCVGQRPRGKVEVCYMPSCPLWVVSDWEPCSAICGSGTQSRRITCEAHNGLIMPDSACDMMTKPPREEKRCYIVCPQRSPEKLNEWIKYPWSQCSVSCGTGIKTRNVTCYGYCSEPKPETSMGCEEAPCADEGVWNAGEWSQCSATCGEGTQQRQIRCESREGESLPSSYCSVQIPIRRQPCNAGPCKPVYKWEVTRWTPCSSRCGKGTRRRRVECKSTRGETVSAHLCLPGRRRPNDTKACKRAPCPYDWDEGEWSQCSSSCGTGYQTRKVRCVENYFNEKLHKEPIQVSERFCQTKTRPDHKRLCKGYCNNGYRWETGVWHPCNKPCSRKGKQKRNLYCYYGKKKVPLRYCPKEQRPERRRKCDMIQCPSCRALQEGFNERRDGEYQLWLKGRNVTIFCYNMQENNPKEYITLPKENFAEIFSPRIRHPGKCASRSYTPDYCQSDWAQANPPGSDKNHGFTVFKKIHINVTSLIIDSTDWTFATTFKGHPVGYGEAGDCHTRGLCPEGMFVINLQSTGFRVSPTTIWVGLGEQHAPPDIHVTEEGEKVFGKCGGCCGFCKPMNGLKLDLLPP